MKVWKYCRSVILRSLLLVWMMPSLAAQQAIDITSLQQQAQAGEAMAQLNLGAAYDNGIGVARDVDKALHWYQKAAEQGVAEAQFNLAHLLVAEEMSAVLAAEWMHRAAAQGMTDAEYLLGVIYAEGIGVEMNKAEARRWLDKAAAKGHEEAQRMLKQMQVGKH